MRLLPYLLLSLTLALCGCASAGMQPDNAVSENPSSSISKEESVETAADDVSDSDKLERINRPVFNFNWKVDEKVLRPVASGYDRAVPGFMRRRVNNFFHWLREPGNMINNALQGDVKGSLASLGRFLINGTIGLGGLFDPSTRMKIYRDRTKMDETLAKWGMKSGTYIVLPFFGPTDVRDLLGTLGDALLTPSFYIEPASLAIQLSLLNVVDTRAEILPLERAIIGDPYIFMREAYQQSRSFSDEEGEEGEAEPDEFDF